MKKTILRFHETSGPNQTQTFAKLSEFSQKALQIQLWEFLISPYP